MKFGLIYEIALPISEEAKGRTESEVLVNQELDVLAKARRLIDAAALCIGDPETICRNVAEYERLGFDQFMCLVQFSDITHRESLRSIELIGKHVIPRFTP